jgi:hypothetical protein
VTFAPTHTVGAVGAVAWPEPDATGPEAPPLEAGVRVEVLERWGDFARVRCENGWETWTDGRALQPIALGSFGRSPTPVQLTGAAGAVLAVAGAFLPWYRAGGVAVNAWDVPLWALITNASDRGGTSAGVPLLLAGLALLLAVAERGGWGLAALDVAAAVPATFGIVRLLQVDGPRPGFGAGLLVALLGGVLIAIAGGLLLWPRRAPAEGRG